MDIIEIIDEQERIEKLHSANDLSEIDDDEIYINDLSECKVLAVDDDETLLKTLKMVLAGVFGNVSTITEPTAVFGIIKTYNPDIVLLDMNFGHERLDGQDGLNLLESIRKLNKEVAIVMMTAFGDVRLAVGTLTNGADGFVTKPWDNDDLIINMAKAINKRRHLAMQHKLVEKARNILHANDSECHMSLEDMERFHIMQAISKCGGNISSVAAQLEVSRQTLYHKLKKYGLM